MELLKLATRRSVFSEATYVILNVLLATTVLVLVSVFDTPLPALALVLLSKWRVLAVRPRFWFANIQTNLVDIMVGVSAVTLLWQAGIDRANGSLAVQIILVVLFAAWLLILKPRSRRHSMLLQAAVAQFVALTALFSVAYLWPSVVVVAAVWLIGYGVARHVLSAYDEEDAALLSFAWAFVSAELGWLAYHWTVAYAPLSNVVNLKIPQIAIIMTGIGYVTVRAYGLYRHEGKIDFTKIRWQLLFVGLLILLVLLGFNGLEQAEL
jgi:hypothetical protein